MNDVLIAIREYLSGAGDAGLRRVIDAPAARWVNAYRDWDGGCTRCLVGHVLDLTPKNGLFPTRGEEENAADTAICRLVGPDEPFPPALVSNIHAIASEILTARALSRMDGPREAVGA